MFTLKRTPVTPVESTAVSAQNAEQGKILMGWRNIFRFRWLWPPKLPWASPACPEAELWNKTIKHPLARCRGAQDRPGTCRRSRWGSDHHREKMRKDYEEGGTVSRCFSPHRHGWYPISTTLGSIHKGNKAQGTAAHIITHDLNHASKADKL